MPTRPPSPEVALRRQQVARLYFQGYLQSQMASELGVTQPLISQDLRALRQEWVQSALMDFNAAKARELAHIDTLEVEYWQGWKRSQQPKRKTTREIITRAASTRPGAEESAAEDNPADPVPYRRVTVVEETQVGNPKFLDGVRECIKLRCQILSVMDPAVVPIDDWDSLSDEQLDRLGRGESAASVLAVPRLAVA
jgi:hypothetical protein